MRRISTRVLAAAIGATLSLAASAESNQRGLDKRNFDTSVAACQDFYQHANGGWMKSNPIPPDYSNWGIGTELRERNLKILKEILDTTALAKNAPGSNAQKIGDFYASAMDEKAIAKAGYAPLKAELARIAALKDSAEVGALIADWQAEGLSPLFSFGALADLKNSSMNIAYAVQGGLGLPERDYYLKDDAESKALRAKYLVHVEKMLKLIDEKNAGAQAKAILALETRLAKASLDQVAMRDPASYYNIVTLAEANKKTPHFDWSAFFARVGHSGIATFSLAQPQFFDEVDKVLAEVPLADWQSYLRWNLVASAAPYLSAEFEKQDFEFTGKMLRGAKEMKPRWKRVMDVVGSGLGEALGQLYVERTFPVEAKQRALALVENLRAALKQRLEKLPWMGAETKKLALVKLATFTPKIGYPDKWRDYSALAIDRGPYIDNVRAATRFETKRQLAKINQPVDKNEWGMTPQTVNAYYNPLANEIVFPAAILQPPFFDAEADDALNYGAIGSVIGHELMHGFDDQGSKFDAQGNMKSWWQDADRKEFETRTAKLVALFDGYVAIDDLHVNGKLTLGENIADLGGLLVAYDAFRIATENQRLAPIDGLTPEQRFFFAFAQGWRSNRRAEDMKLQVNTNPHSPEKFRVIGPLSNMDVFKITFECKAGDAMVVDAAKRVDIW